MNIFPVLLIILDGYGISPPSPGNAIYLANPPNMNSYFYSYPNTLLKASGQSVGLPSGEVGNTEVGHLNIGAGRIVYQDLPRINLSIADGSFYSNQAFSHAIEHIKKTGGGLHLIGLISDGNVHSSVEHLFALIFFAHENHVEKLYIHAITDGRDSPPKSANNTIKRLEEKLTENSGRIVSLMGRYYGLDRDRRWERTEKAYQCLTKGAGQTANSAVAAIEQAYVQGKTDEFIEPTNILVEGQKTLIKDGDAVIFFNYRIDRPRQLTKAFVLNDFENEANKTTSFDPYAVKYYKSHIVKEEILAPPFKREEKLSNLLFITMTEYENNLEVEVAFPPITVQMPLGRVLSEHGIAQLRMSESEKERFVGFYFNGQREMPFPEEDRLIVPSPKVPTYDMKPEMAAYELTNLLVGKMREKKYGFILLNFANPDMVGHTGNIQSTIASIKILDSCIGKIVEESRTLGYHLIITADHGNAEQKINPETGDISTEHTTNPVPFIYVNSKFTGQFIKLQSGILADIAPTILGLLQIVKPDQMSGRNLLDSLQI